MLKKFPNSILKILPAAAIAGLAAAALTGCHSAIRVEASTRQNPVVAPAGTVLRVRLSRELDSEHSRPGDRFVGTLDSAVIAGSNEVLPKGAKVEGHVVATREPGQAVLAVTLDWAQYRERKYPLRTTVITRTEVRRDRRDSAYLWTTDGTDPGTGAAGGAAAATGRHVVLPADSIVGFTLKRLLTV